MLVHWIWFAHRPGLSDREKGILLQHFRDPEEIYYADSGTVEAIPNLRPEARQSLQDKDLTPAEETLEICQRERIQLLTIRDAAYPSRLKNIDDPPVLLYYKGSLPDFDGSPVIGVVGTRKASAYGMQTAKRMGYQIGNCGGILVSGMASGIDGMAMAGALTSGQSVVGVLGCGVDVIYPASNRALFRDTEKFGCILSEFAPGTSPAPWTFPKRNRIISGMSCGVLIVEAPEKSGALITARLALEQGRDVFVVPGNIDQPTCVGSNRLLREGAIPISHGWDVLSEYESLFPDKLRKDLSPSRQRVYASEMAQPQPEETPAKVAQKPKKPQNREKVPEEISKKVIDKAASPPYIDLREILDRLSPEEQSIVKTLEKGERLVDDVIAETGLTTGKLLALLTMLELKGVIRRLPGKRIVLK